MTPYSPTINIVERVLVSNRAFLSDWLLIQTALINGTSLIHFLYNTDKITNSTGTDWLNFTLTVDELCLMLCILTNSPSSPVLDLSAESEGDAGYPEVWAWNGSSVSGVELSVFNSTQTFSSSGSNICMITSDYRAVCWGTSDMGQLEGNTNTINTIVNVTLSSLEDRLILLLENTIHVL